MMTTLRHPQPRPQGGEVPHRLFVIIFVSISSMCGTPPCITNFSAGLPHMGARDSPRDNPLHCGRLIIIPKQKPSESRESFDSRQQGWGSPALSVRIGVGKSRIERSDRGGEVPHQRSTPARAFTRDQAPETSTIERGMGKSRAPPSGSTAQWQKMGIPFTDLAVDLGFRRQ
jgi:hypothetical protein